MSIGKNRILMVIVFVTLLQMKGIGAANENRINLDAVAQHAQQMHLLLNQRKDAGFDVSKAEELDRLSKNAAEKGNYDESLRLINEAKSLLEKIQNPPKNNVTDGTSIAQQAQQMHLLLEQKKGEGFNVSEVEDLDRLSREAAEKGKYEGSLKLINKAISLLEKMKEPPKKQITVELPVNAKRVYLTPAVPNFNSGIDITTQKVFVPYVVNVKGGKVTLNLTGMPVFVEEISESKEKPVHNDEISPFGIHEPPVDTYDTRLDDLGIRWIRLSGPSGVVWDADEPKKGKYNWSRIDNCVSLFHKHNVNTVVTVLCFNKWDQGIRTLKEPGIPVTKLPKHLMEYQSFLKRVVERFDGDSIDDAPGSPIIRYWQIENEPDGIGWKDTPANFARLVKISYKVIKETNPNAKVVLAGIATPDGFYRFYVPMLEALAKMKESPEERVFDVVDIHWSLEAGGDYRAVKGHNMKTLVSDIRNKLDSLGYKNIPIWITEMSTYCGKPSNPLPGVFLKEKSEADHAAELVKSHVYPLSLGVKKIFWTYGLVDRHNLGGQGVNNYFDTVGLIHNPLNEGKSHKKLAYYSYKLMVDKLTGSSNIIPLNLGEGIHAYKYLRDGKSVCVLWYERN